jgi:hypothetical protein
LKLSWRVNAVKSSRAISSISIIRVDVNIVHDDEDRARSEKFAFSRTLVLLIAREDFTVDISLHVQLRISIQISTADVNVR